MVINLIGTDDKVIVEAIQNLLDKDFEASQPDYECFLLMDDDKVEIYRNGDYLEPNPESKANRF